jgi:hypothetical protein
MKCESGRPPVVSGSAKKSRAELAATEEGSEGGRGMLIDACGTSGRSNAAGTVNVGAPAACAVGDSKRDRAMKLGTATGRDGRDGGRGGPVTITRDEGDSCEAPAAFNAERAKL